MDLSDILSRKVTVSPSAAVIDVEVEQAVIDEPIVNEPPIAENVVEVLEEEPNTERPKAMPYDHLAATIVGVLDGLQSSLIPMWRKNSLFTAKELEILDSLDTTGATVYPLNSPEQKILAKFNKHLKLAAQLPFTEAEKERLIAAGERYAATVQLKVSPLTGLGIAFAEVISTRAAIIIND